MFAESESVFEAFDEAEVLWKAGSAGNKLDAQRQRHPSQISLRRPRCFVAL